jgi:hypothetical protein
MAIMLLTLLTLETIRTTPAPETLLDRCRAGSSWAALLFGITYIDRRHDPTWDGFCGFLGQTDKINGVGRQSAFSSRLHFTVFTSCDPAADS